MGYRLVLMLIKVYNDLNIFIGLEIFYKILLKKFFGKVESLKCLVGIKS